MQVTLHHKKASSIYYEGAFYDTEVPLNLDFSTAFRLARSHDVEITYDGVPYNPALWQEKRFINFSGDIDASSGFGNVSYNLLKWAQTQTALAGRVMGVRDQTILAAQNRELEQSGAMVWHDQPREQWVRSPFRKNIAIVPFETTRIPPSWLSRLAGFDALLVPCKQNIQMFQDSGVRLPIELIHWGVDPTQFAPIQRPERDVFTFGHMGALSVRKGTDVLIEAFREAFPKEKDVRLICKTSFPTYPFNTADKRIVVHMLPWEHDELINLFFKEIDCFVFPTRGEGFGLTPLEAMATGVPAIVTGWSGPVEYMTPETGWLLDYKMTDAVAFNQKVYKEPCGDWAEPSKDHLIHLLRHAYNNRDEVKAKGAAAAAHVQKDWTWAAQIGLYQAALEKHLA